MRKKVIKKLPLKRNWSKLSVLKRNEEKENTAQKEKFFENGPLARYAFSDPYIRRREALRKEEEENYELYYG